MGQDPKKLSRRDLFKVGTAIAGAALLQPSVAGLAYHVVSGEHKREGLWLPGEAEMAVNFPGICGRRN